MIEKLDTQWWACSEDIVRMGPYTSQIEAWAALVRVKEVYRPGRLPIRQVHVDGANVWPENS